MGIFNKKGMMVFPEPMRVRKKGIVKKQIVFDECYCPLGHKLVSKNAKFNELDGILLKISKGKESGYIALSPVYGDKTRIAIQIELEDGNLYKISCPECGTELPIFTTCHCGGDIFSLFLNQNADFNSFIGVCNRIGCENAYIQIGEELITTTRQKAVSRNP